MGNGFSSDDTLVEIVSMSWCRLCSDDRAEASGGGLEQRLHVHQGDMTLVW